MDNNFKMAVCVLTGAIGGFFAGKLYCKKKLNRILNEKLADVDEIISNHKEKTEEHKEETEETEETADDNDIPQEKQLEADKKAFEQERIAYNRVVMRSGYTRNSKASFMKDSYIIDEEDYGEIDGYEKCCFHHYKDGILTDENDVQMSDEMIEETVGSANYRHFLKGNEDHILIRNERLKTDFEIIRETEKWGIPVIENDG